MERDANEERCCAQGEHEWAEFLRPSVLAELLRLLVLSETRAQRVLLGAEGEHKWAELLRPASAGGASEAVSGVRATCRD